ncbi:hypothetical protein PoB_006229500 [Plakobranchus ocellatus]|uniref:Uncharacterized protein n=1 Tax=Plakobranchus ocellatus TaxID=259542 RepID=A0AAV4CV89_9GAST|nr:hypothetical protein PoB_006229500 [Plakobranchus ocellatus]
MLSQWREELVDDHTKHSAALGQSLSNRNILRVHAQTQAGSQTSVYAEAQGGEETTPALSTPGASCGTPSARYITDKSMDKQAARRESLSCVQHARTPGLCRLTKPKSTKPMKPGKLLTRSSKHRQRPSSQR